MRDDIYVIQLLKALYDRPNEDDENTGENTLIQYFEAPHEQGILTATVLAQVALQSLSSSPNETVTMNAQSTVGVTDPSTLVWGGLDANGNTIDAKWHWGYGGAWK